MSIFLFDFRAILDGVDLNIHKNSHIGYASFVKKLREIMVNDTSKQYLITGAPGCTYPDTYLGPDSKNAKGTALSSAMENFDHLFIRYYNQPCHPGLLSKFWSSFNSWKALAERTVKSMGKGPNIFVGTLADEYPGRTYFQTIQKLTDLYKVHKLLILWYNANRSTRRSAILAGIFIRHKSHFNEREK